MLVVAVRLQLFQQLRDASTAGVSSQTLAERASIDHNEVARLLRHLLATKVISSSSTGNFCATSLSNELAEPHFQDSILFCHYVSRQGFNGFPEYYRRLPNQTPSYMPEGIDGPFKIGLETDQPFFPWLHNNPPNEAYFGHFMQAYRAGNANWYDHGFYPVVERLIQGFDPATSDVLLVDVGGGKGHDLAMFADHHPSHPGKLVLQDQPAVLDQAIDSALFEKSAHDFFTPQSVRHARAYSLHSILHDWSDANALKILENLKPALKPGYSKVLINEIVLSEEKPTPAATAMDMMMLAHLDARERTDAEFKALLEKAGYRVVEIISNAGAAESVIEAELV